MPMPAGCDRAGKWGGWLKWVGTFVIERTAGRCRGRPGHRASSELPRNSCSRYDDEKGNDTDTGFDNDNDDVGSCPILVPLTHTRRRTGTCREDGHGQGRTGLNRDGRLRYEAIATKTVHACPRCLPRGSSPGHMLLAATYSGRTPLAAAEGRRRSP